MSIREDVDFIRYEFEVHKVCVMSWVSRSLIIKIVLK